MTDVSIIKEPVRCFALYDRYVFFVAADKLNTFKLLSKNIIRPKRIMVLWCVVNFKKF